MLTNKPASTLHLHTAIHHNTSRCRFIAPEYRRPLVVTELLGFQGDVVCLQVGQCRGVRHVWRCPGLKIGTRECVWGCISSAPLSGTFLLRCRISAALWSASSSMRGCVLGAWVRA